MFKTPPTGRPRTPEHKKLSARLSFAIAPAEHARLTMIARREGIALSEVVRRACAAYAGGRP